MRSLNLAVLSLAAVVAVGCGSGKKATTTTHTPSTHTPSTPAAPTTSAPASTLAPAGSALSGKWSGQYSGAYTGTFALNWIQSGSNLSGHIALSAPHATLGIHGTVNGSSIRFGTVGSLAITYSGSVSGNSMSGSYQTPNGGGPWSANKTS